MAATVSAMESGRLSRSTTVAARSQQRAGDTQPARPEPSRANRPLHLRLSPSSSSPSSLLRLPVSALSPRAIRSGSSGGTGGAGGVWASIMSLGALPVSLMPPSAGEDSVHATAAAAGAGSRVVNASSSSASGPHSTARSRAGIGRIEEAGIDGSRSAVAVASGGESGDPSASRAALVRNTSEAFVGDTRGSVATAPGPLRRAAPRKHVYLEGASAVYTCSNCRAHLATRDHVVSEFFHGHHGRAFLFERCVNVVAGRPEDRELRTGMHVVADISCAECGTDLGWKYEEAADKSQKYKVGKYILERYAVTLEGGQGDGCYTSSRGGSSSIIGWGAGDAPYADDSRW